LERINNKKKLVKKERYRRPIMETDGGEKFAQKGSSWFKYLLKKREGGKGVWVQLGGRKKEENRVYKTKNMEQGGRELMQWREIKESKGSV